ncbi:MAG TPA: amidase family protein, partial [Allosphingosinicella sp.]|nr:amidase family protein [Allosphingosinicella sp.]
MSALTDLGVAAIRDGVAAGDFKAREVAEAYIANVEQGRALNAFVVETPEHALAAADAADAARVSGDLKPLSGVPLGIKDLFCTKGVQTTAGSKMLEGYKPVYESTVSGNLLAAGAGMLGKLNMDEFAMGSSNETSAFGNVLSPWRRNDGGNVALTPGGSSGGSATAVSARLAPGVTGTDTGGSIRQPAAFTGITGIKPTYGRCSRYGMVAFASSLDQAGPMARDVRDCAILLEAMAGFDPKDSTSLQLDVPKWEANLAADVRGKKVGIPNEYRIDGVPAEIDAVWEQGIGWLRDAGAEIVEVSLPHTKYALPAYYIIAPAEASSNLARYDGVRYGLRVQPEQGGLQDMYEATRAAGFGPEVKRRIMIGTYVLSAGFYDAYFNQAQHRVVLHVRHGAAGHVVKNGRQVTGGFGDRLEVPVQAFLRRLVVVGHHLQLAIGADLSRVPGQLDGFERGIGAAAGHDRHPALGLLDRDTDDFAVFLDIDRRR